MRLGGHAETRLLERRQKQVPPPRKLGAAMLEDRERLAAECGARRMLRRRRRRDEEMLGELLEAAHRMRGQHDPAEPPAGHAEILREAVHHYDLARQVERRPRLGAI